jgi:site-specific recombinase XerD
VRRIGTSSPIHPEPRSTWCATRSRERWSPLWRPFEGALSAAAQRHTVTILKNLYGFLVDQNYLMGNPWSAVATPLSSGPKVNAGRSLSVAQWAFVCEQLEGLPETSANARLRLAVPLLYATGMRRSEIVAARVDDLEWVDYPADQDGEAVSGWMLNVMGKGEKLRQVPVPTDVVAELSKYLKGRGLSPDPEDDVNKGAYLLGQASDLLEGARHRCRHWLWIRRRGSRRRRSTPS